MNWQQILTLAIIACVGAVFVWRGSGPKKHEHDANCGCGHDRDDKSKKENSGR